MRKHAATGLGLVSGGLVVLVAAGGIAYAASVIAPVDTAGGIHSCYDVTNGKIRLVTPGAGCDKGETELVWNQKGPKGDKGDAGPQGIQGPKGDTGATGPQGIPGDQGPQGDKGDTGPQGPKGDIGATGPQGIQGPKGDTGDTGPAGPAASFYSRFVQANSVMATARCDAGDRATGGGADGVWYDTASYPLVRTTRPLLESGVPVGWLVLMQSPPAGVSSHLTFAYVICADITP